MKRDILSSKAQARVGTPTEVYLIDMVSKGTLKNCPVTTVDIFNARHIFGLYLSGVKSKTVRRKLDRIEVEDVVLIPRDYH